MGWGEEGVFALSKLFFLKNVQGGFNKKYVIMPICQ